MSTFTQVMTGGCAAAALLVTGCAEHAGDLGAEAPTEVVATPSFLRDAVDDSARQPHRFEVSVVVTDGQGHSQGGLDATGAFDGERTHVRVDLEPMASDAALPPGVTRDDLFIETITSSRMLYARAPVFNAMPDDLRLSETTPAAVVALTDALARGWIAVDVAELEHVDPAWAACVLAGQRTDPRAYLDLIRGTDAVEDLGGDEIDGVPVRGLAGDVALDDLLRLQRPEASAGDVGEPGPLAEVTLPVEVWLDSDGLIRRIEVTQDTAEIAAALVGAGLLPAAAAEADGVVITQTMDLWDHGDDSIDIDIPADALDMTDAFREFLLATDVMPTGLEGVEDDLAALERMYDDLDGMYAELDGMYAELDAEIAELEDVDDVLGPLPEIPEPPPMPDLPPAPELPPVPEIPEYPEFPELPPVPEIPEYPDMPEG